MFILQSYYNEKCFKRNFSSNLEEIVNYHLPIWKNSNDIICNKLHEKFEFIFEISSRYSTTLFFPSQFQKRLRKMLKSIYLFNSLAKQVRCFFPNFWLEFLRIFPFDILTFNDWSNYFEDYKTILNLTLVIYELCIIQYE